MERLALKLPTEVLCIMFSFLPPSTNEQLEYFNTIWLPLTLVCKRWKEVAEVLIYSHLAFEDEDCSVLDRLPHCWQYIRSMMFTSNLSNRETCIWMLEEASRKGSPVRQVKWQSDFPWNEGLFKKTSDFPLSSLDLSGLKFGVLYADSQAS